MNSELTDNSDSEATNSDSGCEGEENNHGKQKDEEHAKTMYGKPSKKRPPLGPNCSDNETDSKVVKTEGICNSYYQTLYFGWYRVTCRNRI